LQQVGRVRSSFQVKFYNYHVKRSEIWLVLPTAGQRKSTG